MNYNEFTPDTTEVSDHSNMIRRFAIVKLKKAVMTGCEFPVTHEEFAESPLAGPFTEKAMRAMTAALSRFPFSERSKQRPGAWSIRAPKGGELEIWLTSDGQIWLEGQTTLNLVFGVYAQLVAVDPTIALEDCTTGVVHNLTSLLRLVRHEEQRRVVTRASPVRAQRNERPSFWPPLSLVPA